MNKSERINWLRSSVKNNCVSLDQSKYISGLDQSFSEDKTVETKLCPKCKGSGGVSVIYLSGATEKTCDLCQGEGEIESICEDNIDSDNECPVCFGIGQGEGVDWHCPACRGERVIPETNTIKCIDCNETKEVPYSIHPQYRCNDCAGKGLRAMTPDEIGRECQECDGTGFSKPQYGYSYDAVCSNCGGVGKVPR